MEEINISGLRLRRYRLYNLSTHDCFTDKERALYNSISKSQEKQRETLKQLLEEEIEKSNGKVRIVPAKCTRKDDKPRVDKQIAAFENEVCRLSDDFNSFTFKEFTSDIPFVKEIVILDCNHESILKQIIKNGVIIDNREFIFYASSTNQQKNKQICLMDKVFYNKNINRLMCGLTVDIINSKGGINAGKYLAYKSLVFSKSIEMDTTILIDEVVVMPEFETMVNAEVNYLDMDTLSINRNAMNVPVNHMDGAGMFIPGVFPQSCQIRGGWIKGAVFPFDFKKFIVESESNGKLTGQEMIKDLWGNEIPINFIRDNVKLILNGSQLKMWKYYDSWENYKKAFTDNGLKICINNIMHYPNADNPITKTNYQFYQSLNRKNVTDEKIERLCERTNNMINGAKSSPDLALQLIGADDSRTEDLKPLYAAIKLYPAMLQSDFVKKKINGVIDAKRKMGQGAKPFISGFYNYICPDLYAACEQWLLGEADPRGLIPANRVYNAFFNNKAVEEVCCLRSPHLGDSEHGMRTLIKSEECRKWFSGYDTVISTHDLLTKTLQCDVDGDEMLITDDRAFIDLVEGDRPPLYYEMKKADNLTIDDSEIYNCLLKSFSNINIGDISNALTKHYNMDKEPDLNFIRVLTAYNNFIIDYPKSMYLPNIGVYEEEFKRLSSRSPIYVKFPYFFRYAKEKKANLCFKYEEQSKSTCNRISKCIQKNTNSNGYNIWINDNSGGQDRRDKFNPLVLQNSEIKVDRNSMKYRELINVLRELKKKGSDRYKSKLKMAYKALGKTEEYMKEALYYYLCSKNIMDIFENDREKAAAYLTDIEFYQSEFISSNKDILWNLFGDILLQNLKKTLNKENETPFKRTAYMNRNRRTQEIEAIAANVEQDIANAETIGITRSDLLMLDGLRTRKGCENDKYILYILIFLQKCKLAWCMLHGKEKTPCSMFFRIYKNVRNGRLITRRTLDRWIDPDIKIADKALKRLEKAGYIRIDSCRKYDKIFLLHSVDQSNEAVFTVRGGNPMIPYYEYSGDRKIKSCEICNKKFVARGNAKTCSDKCSTYLEKRNKNKQNDFEII